MIEFYRTILKEKQNSIYEALLRGLMMQENAISIPSSPTVEVNEAFRCVLLDHPEIAWTNGRWRGSSEITDVVFPSYVLTPSQIEALIHELNRWNDMICLNIA